MERDDEQRREVVVQLTGSVRALGLDELDSAIATAVQTCGRSVIDANRRRHRPTNPGEVSNLAAISVSCTLGGMEHDRSPLHILER